MGFNVGSLSRLPLRIFDHFIFIVGENEGNSDARWVKKNFSDLVDKLPEGTALVTGTDENLTNEIEDIISTCGDAWSTGDVIAGELYHFLANGTTLVISRGDIKTTNKPLILIPLATHMGDEQTDETENDREEFVSGIFQTVCDAIRSNELDDLVERIGGVELRLKQLRGGVVLSTLKRLNECVDLKPNVIGVGLNINAIVENWLKNVQPTR